MTIPIPGYKKPKNKINPYRAVLVTACALGVIVVNAFILCCLTGVISLSGGWGFLFGMIILPVIILDGFLIYFVGMTLSDMADDWDNRQAQEKRRLSD